MRLQNADVAYKILLKIGSNKGEIVELVTSLEELEENPLSQQLIDNDHLDHCCHPSDAYDVVERRILNADEYDAIDAYERESIEHWDLPDGDEEEEEL